MAYVCSASLQYLSNGSQFTLCESMSTQSAHVLVKWYTTCGVTTVLRFTHFFCCIIFAWFFDISSVTYRTKLTCITNTARIIGLPAPNLSELNNKAIARIVISIAQDITHPLNHNFTLMPSGHWYKALWCRRACFWKSLIPAVIATLNINPHWTGLSVFCCLSSYVVVIVVLFIKCCLVCTVLWKWNLSLWTIKFKV